MKPCACCQCSIFICVPPILLSIHFNRTPLSQKSTLLPLCTPHFHGIYKGKTIFGPNFRSYNNAAPPPPRPAKRRPFQLCTCKLPRGGGVVGGIVGYFVHSRSDVYCAKDNRFRCHHAKQNYFRAFNFQGELLRMISRPKIYFLCNHNFTGNGYISPFSGHTCPPMVWYMTVWCGVVSADTTTSPISPTAHHTTRQWRPAPLVKVSPSHMPLLTRRFIPHTLTYFTCVQ